MPDPDPHDIALADDPGQHRFELRAGGKLAAYAEYNVLANALLFTHTETVPGFEGLGLASRLAGFALDEVRRRGLGAIPVCQFIAAYLRKHPEYHDLVTPANRRAFHI